MKKLLAGFVLFVFSFGIFGQAFADDTDKTALAKDIVTYSTNLKKTKKGATYLVAMDAILEQYKDNVDMLTTLSTKIPSADLSVLGDKTLEESFKYLGAKATLTLLSVQDNEQKELLSSNVSASDKEMVEEKIIELQQTIVDKGEAMMNKIMQEYSSSLNRKEQGDVNVNIELNEETLGKLKGLVEIKDFTGITNQFDSHVTGNMNLFFNYVDPATNEETELDMQALIDLISKEGSMFFMLKNISFTEKNLEEAKAIMDKLTEFAVKNQYVKYEDPSTQMIFDFLKSFNTNGALTDARAFLNNPLLEAYRVEGDKYYLRPTKFVCDTYKGFMATFLLGEPTCSDAQYTEMLTAFAEMGNMYLVLNDAETTFGYEGNPSTSGLEEFEGYITFNDDIVTEYYLSIKPSQTEFPGDLFNLVYEDGNLTGELVVTNNYAYNAEIGEMTTSVFEMGIEGTADTDTNEVETLNITYKSTTGGETTTSGEFDVTENNFRFTHNTDSYTSQADVSISGTKYNGSLTDLNSRIDVSYREFSFDPNTFAVTYADTYSKIFTSNITINNRIINGDTIIYSGGEKLATIFSTGNIDTNVFNLNNKIELTALATQMIYGENTDHNITGDLNLNVDTRNNVYNVYFLLDVIDKGITIIKYEIDGKTTYENTATDTIDAPTDTIDLEEAFGIDLNSMYNYGY